jgi:hypothetical protein
MRQLLGIRSQFVLTGNIRDDVLLGEPDRLEGLIDALWTSLQPLGYQGLLVWDRVDGLRGYPDEPARLQAMGSIGGQDLSRSQPMQLDTLAGVIRRLSVPPDRSQPPAALVVDFASRLRGENQIPEDARSFFLAAEKAALAARPVARRAGDGAAGSLLFNPIIWLANRASDMPHWLTVDNERVRSIPIPLPLADMRYRAALGLWRKLHDKDDLEAEAFAREFSGMTDNLSFVALQDIVALANRHGIGAADIKQAVQSFRVGDMSLQSPWRGKQLRQRINEAESGDLIRGRVLGQPQATLKVLDILKRTSIGLTGAQTHGSASRPRGVLFFAGPTGVGKTEMAKTIAEIVFGDRDAFLRFDMSEYSAEHSEARLIGAPPGYVGFDEGGQLTNALRERPFRVVLFDEIEKAHNRILDKFLQILEDGRLTDGRGETVYFSDALVVFTSNAGISRRQPDGSVQTVVSPATPPEDFERLLEEGIDDYFIRELRRPELLNRIGENVVIFRYIQPDIGARILDGMLDNVRRRVREEQQVDVQISHELRSQLLDLCVGSRLDNGGRGISAKLEAVFVNPLARLMFDRGPSQGSTLVLSILRAIDGGHELVAN